VGRLDKALDEAKSGGWTVIDMKQDWKRVFRWRSLRGGLPASSPASTGADEANEHRRAAESASDEAGRRGAGK
jgi:hypothetical protein